MLEGELGAWLRQQRQARGWGKRDMARRLLRAGKARGDTQLPGIDGLCHNIRRWEKGQGGLSERYRLLYCEALGIPAEEFGVTRSMTRREVLADAGGAVAAAAVRRIPALLPPPAITVAPWAVPVFDAVLDPVQAARQAAATLQDPNAPITAYELSRSLAAIMSASLASDYGRLARLLPGLIGGAELAAIHADDGDQSAIQQLVCDVYAVAGWALIKADSPAAAWIAAQRAVRAAEDAADPLRSAAATRCLAEVHMRAGNLEDATRVAFLSTAYLDTAPTADKRAISCLRGAALLSAAAAAARRGDSREAYAALNAASTFAAELGEDWVERDTMFGPSNVAIHKVAIPVELGNCRQALSNIPAVDVTRMPVHMAERRARFLIDVARCYHQAGDDTAAADALAQAEQAAPDETRNHRHTHDLVRALLPHSHRASAVRELAIRCQLN